MDNYFISYAQNYEDIILFSLLKGVEDGFYIDVGANHPSYLSVTKLFYDRGWHGMNIEPIKENFDLFTKERSRDENYNLAISAKNGITTLRYYPNYDGLSTTTSGQKTVHSDITDYEDRQIKTVTLETLLKNLGTSPIHFLKVDVEGGEMSVLQGNDWKKYRPWAICVETEHVGSDKVQIFLSEHDYQFIFFDGVNDYYIAKEHQDLIRKFNYAYDIFSKKIFQSWQYDLLKESDNAVKQLSRETESLRAYRNDLEHRLALANYEIERDSHFKRSAVKTAKLLDNAITIRLSSLLRNGPNRRTEKKAALLGEVSPKTLASVDHKLIRQYDYSNYLDISPKKRRFSRAPLRVYSAIKRPPEHIIRSVIAKRRSKKSDT